MDEKEKAQRSFAFAVFSSSPFALFQAPTSIRTPRLWHRCGDFWRSQCLDGGADLGQQAIDTLLQARGMRANQASYGLTVGVKDKGWHSLNALLDGGLRILINIHTSKAYLAGVRLAQFFIDRGQSVAGRAPGSREVDNHRQLRLQNLGGKILIADGQNMILLFH
jgi:hypothetical protein